MKNIIMYSGIGLIGLALFGRKKLNDVSTVLSKLQAKIVGVSNIRFGLPYVRFNLTLRITNPTEINFNANVSSNIKIKNIRVYSDNGFLLGNSVVNVSNISLPEYSSININNVETEINLEQIGTEFFNNIDNYLANDFSKLKYKIDVEVLGKIITLNT